MQRANVYFHHGHLIHLLLFDVEALGPGYIDRRCYDRGCGLNDRLDS